MTPRISRRLTKCCELTLTHDFKRRSGGAKEVRGSWDWPVDQLGCQIKYICNTVGIWNLTISMGVAIFPTIWKPDHLKSRHFFRISNGFRPNGCHFSGLPMVGLPDYRNPDHLQPNLFLTILNPDLSGFQIPIVFSLQQHTTFSFQESPTVPSRLGTGWTGKFPYANAINF